ncbi:hypothetical protein DFA_06369 [Cavenderia fasciculata]|uniref:RING-type domain-containing protein n=1 Tax=Cavenderia fasciculata TaxID=261658 RepID=F4PKU8_CACFS|nr:uncharacterized protein DFA_06369 [Cavenderia fasciculata]EGG24222.1 hypothetical protein DFA_06369 [Cavenderia fasciculata]|eukprot:XP_004362073.1 hypothetical protein DFA_06369 [Cavenderia fasciculata]
MEQPHTSINIICQVEDCKSDKEIVYCSGDYSCDSSHKKEGDDQTKQNDHKFIRLKYNDQKRKWVMESTPIRHGYPYINELVSFIGPSGSGKSAILRSLLQVRKDQVRVDQTRMTLPLPTPDSTKCRSTSEDIDYYLRDVEGVGYRVFLDSEGSGGTGSELLTPDQLAKRLKFLQEIYPRLLHIISGMVVYVFNNTKEQDTFIKDLSKMVSHIESKAINSPYKCHLLVIFNNQVDLSESGKDVDFFQRSEFINSKEVAKIKSFFKSCKSISLPKASTEPVLFLGQLKSILKHFDVSSLDGKNPVNSIDDFFSVPSTNSIKTNRLDYLSSSSNNLTLEEKYKAVIDHMKMKLSRIPQKDNTIDWQKNSRTQRQHFVELDIQIQNSIKCQSTHPDHPNIKCDLAFTSHELNHRSLETRKQKVSVDQKPDNNQIFGNNSLELEESIEWSGGFKYPEGMSFDGLSLFANHHHHHLDQHNPNPEESIKSSYNSATTTEILQQLEISPSDNSSSDKGKETLKLMANVCIFCLFGKPNRLRLNCEHSFCDKCIGDGDNCLFCNIPSEIIRYIPPPPSPSPVPKTQQLFISQKQTNVKKILLNFESMLECIVLLAFQTDPIAYTNRYNHLKKINFINSTYEQVLLSIFQVVPDQSFIGIGICLFFVKRGAKEGLAYSPEMTFLSNRRDIENTMRVI